MKAIKVSKECDLPLEEQIELIKSYDVGAQLKVVREFENELVKFESIIVLGAVGRLHDMGIKCMW